MILRGCTLAGLALMLLAGGAAARPPGPADPNWPCEAVKVPSLDLAQVWSGPSVDPVTSTWQDDPAVAGLVRDIAQRRMPLDEAKARMKAFAQQAGTDKQAKLLNLVAGLFSVMNTERTSVIDGLDRFGARQKELATGLRDDNEKLRQMQADPKADAGQVNQLLQKVTWEAEVFQDRRQELQYACEVPSKIEQRLYALSQAVSRELQPSPQ